MGARSLGNYTERFRIKCEMKAPRIDPAVRELAVLSALAALGCGLAAAQGDLWFVAVFGAASVVTIIEAIRRLQ
jgi:alkylhydroperoxidase/carboxymuconolactone decarboxylase family protein YurZ